MKVRGMCMAAWLLLPVASAVAQTAFNIAIPDDGFYRLNFDDLEYAGSAIPSNELALSEQGSSIGFELIDGGDGMFGPGDYLVFAGRRLAGENSWYNQYSRHNVYRLSLDGTGAALRPPEPLAGQGLVVRHMEQDKLRVALSDAGWPALMERWFWQRISYLDGEQFALELDLEGDPERIRISVAGLSRDRHASKAGLPQHQLKVLLDGQLREEVQWDGQEAITVEATLPNPAANSRATLSLQLPRRVLPNTDQAIVDAVLLNWIELDYPEDADLPTIPAREGGRRLVVSEGHRKPAWIRPMTKKGELGGTDLQADYLFIAHPALIDTVKPLAELHRQAGLRVEIVDVHRVYDAFSHGVASPYAIQSFLAHAVTHWQAPAPRFVLLVGDASWQPDSPRNLVPTFQVMGHKEIAASDNGLVTPINGGWRPELAVGRLPAGDAAELKPMIDKLLAYQQADPEGDWQRRSLWMADVDPGFQRISNRLSARAARAGLVRERVYPEDATEDQNAHQARIQQAFSKGALLAHFLGHGGRYVWRTGPVDLQGASDLFDIDDIAQLPAGVELPLVLSMTCSSGPFDHPQVGSLAESFLGAPRRGAIGVLAASWRVPASQAFSRLLVDALLDPQLRVGEAILKAKQQEKNRVLVESYNYLGDPALSLPLPDAAQ